MSETLFIAVPLAFIAGCAVACVYARRRCNKPEVSRLSVDYYKGLNYLLNEKPDKALGVFLRLVEVDGDTVETHMTLGKLFRRRGEIENAIRVHQNLIARPNLSPDDRSLATLELGKDYRSAGVLDRAEGLFKDVYETGKYQDKALHALRHIFEQEQEWHEAIKTAESYERLTGRRQNKLMAHYYCELARVERDQGNIEALRRHLLSARQQDAVSLRAWYMQAEQSLAEAQYDDALHSYMKVIEIDERFAPYVLPKMQQCLDNTDNKRMHKQIDSLFKQLREQGVYLTPLTNRVKQQGGVQEAKRYLEEVLDTKPGIEPLKDWLALHPVSVDSADIIRQLDKLESTNHAYQCEDCGYNSRRIQWHCPSCSRWGSIVPVSQ